MTDHSTDREIGADGRLTELARLQRWAVWATALFGALWLLSAAGLALVSRFPGDVLLHGLLFGLGALAARYTLARRVEIDEERWEIVADDALTSGELSLAHKEAERRIRMAGTAFFLVPIALAGFLAYQMQLEDTVQHTDVLLIAPVVGFGVGLWWLRGRYPIRDLTDV